MVIVLFTQNENRTILICVMQQFHFKNNSRSNFIIYYFFGFILVAIVEKNMWKFRKKWRVYTKKIRIWFKLTHERLKWALFGWLFTMSFTVWITCFTWTENEYWRMVTGVPFKRTRFLANLLYISVLCDRTFFICIQQLQWSSGTLKIDAFRSVRSTHFFVLILFIYHYYQKFFRGLKSQGLARGHSRGIGNCFLFL